LSPRIDHRPPVFAFLFLVVLAIAVVGTNARALDRAVVAGDPIEAKVHVSGTALMTARHAATTSAAAERSRPVSRGASRSARADHLSRSHATAAARSLSEHRRHARHGWDHAGGRRFDAHGFLGLGRPFGLH